MAKRMQKPYPNYHAARAKSPGLFVRIRVLDTSKEGIMFYGGPLKSKPRGSTELQAIRFPKDKFSVKEAKKWLKDHKQNYILFEPASVEKKMYVCECIECGHTTKSNEHCKDLNCSKCGSQMRRKERPGPGQKSTEKAKWPTILRVLQ